MQLYKTDTYVKPDITSSSLIPNFSFGHRTDRQKKTSRQGNGKKIAWRLPCWKGCNIFASELVLFRDFIFYFNGAVFFWYTKRRKKNYFWIDTKLILRYNKKATYHEYLIRKKGHTTPVVWSLISLFAETWYVAISRAAFYRDTVLARGRYFYIF